MSAIIKDTGYNAKILRAYLLIPPFAVFVIMGASWIHAKILNMTIRIMGKGPIVEGKSLVQDRTGEFKRNSWDR
ncbi:MAG: hypothetical protein JXR23_02765 [Pontiellaceae bacterium]|nr:hypothetical protein [Pontiellaceae bacterium]